MEPNDNRGVLALVLGLVGLLTCQVASPFAAYIGYTAVRDAHARGEQPDGLATAGMILGIVGTLLLLMIVALLALYVLIIVASFVLYFVMMIFVVGLAVLSGG